ncbi:hypothetical protein NG697_12505 [Pseudarthrobacter sp. MDT3-26]|uniref:hypothetical protein n=1 Tax=Pseudarthrobacter raffinosi TaxID=2953651 RepID=UPI00208EFDC4|nr:hypothetical protein [Pseudarthrobacter sp. MDT3-26]MCO4263733.1 hypothetical protein [Pseudarthrobacter sp. MDT3-26]
MKKATAEQQILFEAALKGVDCIFKVSSMGNLNIIGGDRATVTEAATENGFFVAHAPEGGFNGSVVGYDDRGFDHTGYDSDGYDARGFNGLGLNKDGLTRSAARAAKKAAPRVLASAVEILRETADIRITKEDRRLYFATSYGHQMAAIVKDAGGTWEPASKRWRIGAAGNMELVEVFDELTAQERVYASQDAEREIAAEAAKTAELASLVWVSIPFEATSVRKAAKRLQGKYDPLTKRWRLLPDFAVDVNSALGKWRTAQAAKAGEKTAPPISLYTFNPDDALVEQAAWTVGQTIWAESEDAFVTLVTVKRAWRSGEADDGGADEAGCSYTATGRLATHEEITALKAQRKERNK